MWQIQVYENSDYVNEFNALNKAQKDAVDALLEEISQMNDPEDHKCSLDCPSIPNINYAIKFLCEEVILIVALDRIMENTDFEEKVISLYSCSA